MCLLLVTASVYAQREFWGVRSGENGTTSYGNIFKTDLNGENFTPVHMFDGVNGYYPRGRLFLASNGKLYGTAYRGGYTFPDTNNQTGGVLFEYDLILDIYRVVASFGSSQIPTMANPESGVIEPVPGILYGTTSFGGIYKYNMGTEVITRAGAVPNIGGSLSNPMRGELVTASNGYVYGVTQNYSACLQAMPFVGAVVRLNPANDAFSFIYPFNCNEGDGKAPTGSLIEAASGKLYGTTWAGGDTNDGVLFEYDTAANTYTKKINFNADTTGGYPGPLTLADNGKLYGVLGMGGHDIDNPDREVEGTIFEYDITANTVTPVHYFERVGDNFPTGRTPLTNTLLKSHDGYLYGANNRGIFRFDPLNSDSETNVVMTGHPQEYSDLTGDLTEICRKPRYRAFETTEYALCAGSPFTFDVHNTNAITYTWYKGAVAIPGMTTGILHFDSIAVGDSGVYTCVMTNECGTTSVPGITLIVNQATSSTITSNVTGAGATLLLCPGTSATLSGNNGGTWNTGATTPTIQVTEAGNYQIINTNTCGDTYSNIVTVVMYEVPNVIIKDNEVDFLPPNIYISPICVGAPITLYGNTAGGVWQDGSTGPTFTTTVALNTDYYVTTQHECGTYTSNIIRFTTADIVEEAILPVLTPTNSLSICNDGGVGISTNRPATSRNAWSLYKDGSYYLDINNSNGNLVILTQPGTYHLERTSLCFGIFASAPVVITAANEPPPVPVITVNGEVTDFITLCSEESVTLTSSAATGNVWSNGETTQSIVVSETGSFGVTVTNACGENTSNFVSTFSLLPDATVSMAEGNNTLTSNESNATYQWLECSIAAIPPVEIAGATAQSFTPDHDGLYAVRVTNMQGCTATSQCFAFGTMGINPNDAVKNIILYPNPAKEKITLQTSTTIKNITIVNMLGQTVVKAENTTEVDTSALSQGQYILIAQTNNGIWRGKFVKN